MDIYSYIYIYFLLNYLIILVFFTILQRQRAKINGWKLLLVKDYDSEDEPVSRCTRQGVLLRILIAAFAILTAFLIIIAIALILTQKPIDLSLAEKGNRDYSNVSDAERLQEKEQLEQYHRMKPNYNKFTFDQLFSGKLFLRDSYEYNWLSDGSLIRKKDEFLGTSFDALKIPPNSFESEQFMTDYELTETLSANLKYAYRRRIIKQLFRHSAERVYEVVKIENGTAGKMSWPVGLVENATIQGFYWNPAPNASDFVYVHNYNVYYQASPEKPEGAVKLTNDGEYYYRYGVANWLYEEEILDGTDALWWSPSGRYVSWLRFDDRNVNRIFLPTYTPSDSYVEYFEIPYPKAGVYQNTQVTQFIWDRENNKIVEAVAPDELRSNNESFYIMHNVWMTTPVGLSDLGTERLITVWSNRIQNKVYYTLCSEVDCVVTFTQHFDMNGRSLWAEPKEVGSIFPTKTGFFTILPHPYKDKNIYNHIAHIELETSGTGKITKWIGENYDVQLIKGYWKEKDILTFTAWGPDIGELNLYKIPKATNQKLVDSISKLNALIENCNHGAYSVDPTGKKAVLMCHEPFENTRFFMMNVDKPRSKHLIEGEEKAQLPFDKLPIEYGKVTLPSGIECHFSIMKPPHIQEGQKLPLLLDIYGGPNSKKVFKNTPSAHFIQMASQYEAVVVNLDVSGTAGRGWDVKEPVYKNLGMAETKDTLDMIQHLVRNYAFIDEDNVAVMGWSYGGYLSSQIAVRDQGETVKCVVSIAPVTNFRYYDTAYTERYMDMPEENEFGYLRTNLVPHARNMTNVKYFLAHGEKDDNVHYQNSARWSEALQISGVHFTQLVYANEAHSISGKIQHLYSEIQRFLFEDCFKPNSLSMF